jgi:hypothetical protein
VTDLARRWTGRIGKNERLATASGLGVSFLLNLSSFGSRASFYWTDESAGLGKNVLETRETRWTLDNSVANPTPDLFIESPLFIPFGLLGSPTPVANE